MEQILLSQMVTTTIILVFVFNLQKLLHFANRCQTSPSSSNAVPQPWTILSVACPQQNNGKFSVTVDVLIPFICYPV